MGQQNKPAEFQDSISMPYWCSNCGGDVPGPDTKTCPHCRVSLSHVSEGTQEEYELAQKRFRQWKRGRFGAKILKGLALSLLGFLLFLSLAIFGVLYMLNNTLLKPEFLVSELDRLDVSAVTAEIINLQAPPEMPYFNEVVSETIDELEPWMKEQLSTTIYSGYDYFLGKTEDLSLTISIQPVKDTLRGNLWEAFSASLPPELQGRPKAEQEQYFNDYYQQLVHDIPSTVEFTKSSLPLDALNMMKQVRQAIGYFPAVYYGLIGFMFLLVMGIILIIRQVKDVTRRLGVPLLTYGAIEYAGIWVARYFTEKPMPLPEIPPYLETWMFQFIDNLLHPLEIFSLGLLIGGIALIVVSFVYPRWPPI